LTTTPSEDPLEETMEELHGCLFPVWDHLVASERSLAEQVRVWKGVSPALTRRAVLKEGEVGMSLLLVPKAGVEPA
jgi:hypothetical protein